MSLKRSGISQRVRRDRNFRPRSKHHLPSSERLQFRWAAAIPQSEWRTYRLALDAMREVGLRFMIGGGFAFAAYTGRWRDTKDIDLYVKPQDRQSAIEALTRAGFEDYYRRLPYDRKWIYRGIRSDVIVDIIWAMANQRAQVDNSWLQRAPVLSIRGEKLSVIPVEELVWCKLYILQRDRCDWTDIFNVLYARGGRIDWKHLIRRLEDDAPLLHALLTVYGWLCPRSALQVPRSFWRCRPTRVVDPHIASRRSKLLDSRGWFAPMQASNRKLEI